MPPRRRLIDVVKAALFINLRERKALLEVSFRLPAHSFQSRERPLCGA
uniref:Uncharacterized protein n=1 Tax=Vibrio tasmaniensis TaxID=212663 RepID=A0A0H4A1C8_9VIBR|nr:hypothetical protein [Vibrio tasmaniensis]